MSPNNDQFERLIFDIQNCSACACMQGCSRVLSWANGSPGADLMFVGEAPGRLGADRTGIPFHGDKAGDNFEKLLALAGLSRKQVFVTNAVLCNPRDEKGNNAPPSRNVLVQCANNLRRQIEVVRPLAVVTLGGAALEATRIIEPHCLTLSNAVRKTHDWNGLKLIPLYHPGARAMIHRNFATQSADYYFVGEFVRRQKNPQIRRTKSSAKTLQNSWNVVRYIIENCGTLSLFRLHKILYLIDYRAFKERNEPVTMFVYIRQKDGPYCVELGSKWFKEHSDNIKISMRDKILHLSWIDSDLFALPAPILDEHDKGLIDAILDEAAQISDTQLKTRAYLTHPMKAALKAEREGYPQLNKPLL